VSQGNGRPAGGRSSAGRPSKVKGGREPAGEALLRELEAEGTGVLPRVLDARRVALVVAHPDDESVGLGAQLPRLSGVRVVHVTDGAPANMADARAYGFDTREEYAAARRDELEAAMAVAGIPPMRVVGLGIADQEASFVMPGLARRLAELFDRGDVGAVLTHPYEGGHPDHDATCFAVHAAVALLRGQGLPAPDILEMASYHAGPDGRIRTGLFLPRPGREVALLLDMDQQMLKRRLFDCHRTQRAMLEQFPLEVERVRPAPSYDFLAPPHPGRLFYEQFDWGVDGERWRGEAAASIAQLGLEAPPWR